MVFRKLFVPILLEYYCSGYKSRAVDKKQSECMAVEESSNCPIYQILDRFYEGIAEDKIQEKLQVAGMDTRRVFEVKDSTLKGATVRLQLDEKEKAFIKSGEEKH